MVLNNWPPWLAKSGSDHCRIADEVSALALRYVTELAEVRQEPGSADRFIPTGRTVDSMVNRRDAATCDS